MNDFRVTLHELTDEQRANRELCSTIEFIRPNPISFTEYQDQSLQEEILKILKQTLAPYDGRYYEDHTESMTDDLSKALSSFLSTDRRFKQGA